MPKEIIYVLLTLCALPGIFILGTGLWPENRKGKVIVVLAICLMLAAFFGFYLVNN